MAHNGKYDKIMEPLAKLLLKYTTKGSRYAYYPPTPRWNGKRPLQGHLPLPPKKVVGLYVHIPFCESLCTFCGCNIKVTPSHQVEVPYLKALLKEWNLCQQEKGLTVDSIYLGGGTPHFFSPSHMSRLLASLLQKVDGQKFNGTIEADPRRITVEQLDLLREFNFNRLILGVQDFDEKVLKNINRRQEKKLVEQTIVQAKKRGFEVVGEFIYGLPLQCPASLGSGLAKVEEMGMDGVMLYPLAQVPWQKAGQSAYGGLLPSIHRGKSATLLGQREELRTTKLYPFGTGVFFAKKLGLGHGLQRRFFETGHYWPNR